MTYYARHWSGDSDHELPVERFGELLDELAVADREHGDVAITHESEWCLTVSRSGIVVLENLEDGDPVHAGPFERTEVLRLMAAVARGEIEALGAGSWKRGYRPTPGP